MQGQGIGPVDVRDRDAVVSADGRERRRGLCVALGRVRVTLISGQVAAGQEQPGVFRVRAQLIVDLAFAICPQGLVAGNVGETRGRSAVIGLCRELLAARGERAVLGDHSAR